MTRTRRNIFAALVLGLAVLGSAPPAVQAAEPAGVTTLWNARWQYVRLVPRDGGTANRHPTQLTKAEIRSAVAQIKLEIPGDEPADFLTLEERDFYADQISQALTKVGPDQDIVIATIGLRKGLMGLKEQRLSTARLFVNEDGLNVIVGEALAAAPEDTTVYRKADARLISFADGKRSGPASTNAKWKLAGANPAVAVKRGDWVAVPAAVMAIPAPGTPEAEKQTLDEVQQLKVQMQQLQQMQKGQQMQAPRPAEIPAAQPLARSVEERLRALDDLKTKGLLSPEEYVAKRRQILDSL